jgi:hypothetical protein
VAARPDHPPRDQITEKFLGVSPMQNRRIYFDASPTSYATVEKNEKTRTRFLLIYGTDDDIVDRRPNRKSLLTLSSRPASSRAASSCPDRGISGRASGGGAGQLRRPGRPADAAFPAGGVVTSEGTIPQSQRGERDERRRSRS